MPLSHLRNPDSSTIRGFLDYELEKLLSRINEINTAENSATELVSAPDINSGASTSEFLGITKSQYSRLRNGKISLTTETANKLAEGFYPLSGPLFLGDESDERRQKFIHNLQFAAKEEKNTASNPQAVVCVGSTDSIEEFFKQLAVEGNRLFVEYRDLPRASPMAKYKSLSHNLAEAIFGGMDFAMFFPFGSPSTENKKKPNPSFAVTNYLKTCREAVATTFELILSEIANHTIDEINEASSPQIAEQIFKNGIDSANRIVLYERSSIHSGFQDEIFGGGIQSRLFYCEYNLQNPNSPSEEMESEVWEWVACVSDRYPDYFLKRDVSSCPPTVIKEQFFPVSTFLDITDCLPTSNQQLKGWTSSVSAQENKDLPDFNSVADEEDERLEYEYDWMRLCKGMKVNYPHSPWRIDEELRKEAINDFRTELETRYERAKSKA